MTKPVSITRLTTSARALTAWAGLLVLVACSSAPATPTTIPETLTPSSSSQIALPLVTGRETISESAAATDTPQPLPAEPLSVATATATGRAAISPLPSPTPGQDELSPAGGLAPGSPAPGFALASAQGGRVTLSDYRDKSKVVLVFYRGQT